MTLCRNSSGGVLEANSNAKEKATKESYEKTTGKGKRKGSNSNENRIPKKARVEKS